jgi:hypothetical protein
MHAAKIKIKKETHNTFGILVDKSTGHHPITSLEGFGYTRLSWAPLTEQHSEQGHF